MLSIRITSRLLLVACLVATAKGDGWDDFSNNLATDLTPLITLFGEQVTKQFLSESTTFLDNLIFAMAPLGVLTAVVSVIRVCGGASLRAFIGRAQEGGGIAEAELCSSTSRDVCELYHNGAIVRVFGRPKILEIVHDRKTTSSGDSNKEQSRPGIYSFQDYVGTKLARDAGWREQSRKDSDVETQKSSDNDNQFAPNPNLSFNIGIKEQPGFVLWLAAIAGLLVQAAVVVFGAFATYKWRWTKNGALPPPWAFPLMVLGTVLLDGGMFLCAFLIENSTEERVFRRASGKDEGDPILYVVQPGNQIIGDQTFDAFSFTDASNRLTKYTTSWKLQKKAELQVSVATGITLAGFVLQFVGLRAMHSSVSVFQLGAILLMSIVRAGLRTKRLAKEQNLLHDRPDEVEGHELDWLALKMAKDRSGEQGKETRFWSVTGGLAELQPLPDGDEGNDVMESRRADSSEAFLYRSRLAELTSQPTRVKSKSSTAWDERLVQVRQQARLLKQAIESSAGVLFTQGKVKPNWREFKSVLWTIKVVEHDELRREEPSKVCLSLRRGEGSEKFTTWEMSQNDLEAVCGLWAWSIISDPQTEKSDKSGFRVSEATEVPVSRIMAVGDTKEELERLAKLELGLWIDTPWSASVIHCEPEVTRMRRGISWESRDTEVSTCYSESNPQRKWLRLHGWQIVPDDPGLTTLALTTTVTSSISTTCTHDIYQSFLCAITEAFDSIGGETRVSKGSRGILFTNEVVTRLAECFKESGLGSIQDAYLVIIPALRFRSKLPLSDDDFRSVYIIADNSRKEGSFEDAEDLLKWTWQNLSQKKLQNEGLLTECMLELGELYRNALFRTNEASITFASNGISWMKRVTPGSTADIVNRYVDLEKRYKEHRLPETNAQEVMDAISRNDRTTAIWLISHVKQVQNVDSNGRSIISWAAQQGWQEIVKIALEIGCAIDDRDESKRTPLSYAAEHGNAEVAQLLMNAGALPLIDDSFRRTPISYAAGGGHDRVLKALLEDRRVTVVTRDKDGQSPLHWAAKNRHCDTIALLLQYKAKIPLDDVDNHGYTALIIALLSRQRSSAELLVTNGARFDTSINKTSFWKWAVENAEWTCVEFLLNKFNERSDKRKTVVVTIRPKGCRPSRIAHSPALEGLSPAIVLYELGQDGTPAAVTMETVRLVVSGEYRVDVEIYEQGVVVPKKDLLDGHSWLKNISYSSSASDSAKCKTAGLLLDWLGKEVKITEEVFLQAVRKGEGITKFLLDWKPEGKITEGIVQAAARNQKGKSILKLLLDQRGEEIKITEGIVQAAAGNKEGEPILELLLDQRGEEIKITEGIIQAAAGNKEGKLILELLLDQRGEEIKITESIVQAATGNEEGKPILELLLDQKGEEIKITESIIQAAAGNKYGRLMLKLLLDQRGGEIKITESIVQAAAGNTYGTSMLELLLDQRGGEIKITESIVQAAAGNMNGKSMLELLLDQRGEEIKITESIVQAAARNMNGTSMLELLLNQKGKEIKITESIVQEATRNISGQSMLKLLLDQKGEEIKITESIIKAAAGQWDSEFKMRQLLDGRARVKITEDMEKCVKDVGDEELNALLEERKQDRC